MVKILIEFYKNQFCIYFEAINIIPLLICLYFGAESLNANNYKIYLDHGFQMFINAVLVSDENRAM